MNCKFQVVGEGLDSLLMTATEFAERFGHRFVKHFTKKLQDKNSAPKVLNLIGPMYNGEKDGFEIVRYETWVVYESLSN